MRPATRQLVETLASWMFLGLVIVVTVTQFETIKDITAQILGLPATQELAKSQPEKPQNSALHQINVSNGVVEIPASRNGHYFSEALMNGRRIQSMVDTGASAVALTYSDAEDAGIFVSPSDFTIAVQTANGIARVAPVMIDSIEIGDILVRDVQGVVSEPGSLNMTLLGMSFLRRLSRFEMRDSKLILEN